MKKLYNALVIFMIQLLTLHLYAQPPQPDIKWVKVIGNNWQNQGISVLPLQDGGFVVVGNITGNSTGFFQHQHNFSSNVDVGIVKYDAQKNVLWKKCIGSDESDEVYKILEASNGDYILCTRTKGSNDDVPPKLWQNQDIWLCRMDTAGNIKWGKTYGTNGNDTDLEMIATLDGGLMLGASTTWGDGDIDTVYNGIGYSDAYLLKLDSAGNKEWSKNYGGTSHDFMRGLVQGKDSMYYIAMDVESIDLDAIPNGFALNGFPDPNLAPSADLYVAKIDQQGNMVWHYNYGGSFHEYMNGGLVYNDDHTLYIAGGTMSDDYMASCNQFFDEDYLLVKIDTSGKVLWNTCVGGSGVDICHGICSNGYGGCIVYGRSKSEDGDLPFNFPDSNIGQPTNDGVAVNIAPDGSRIWTAVVGGSSTEYIQDCKVMPNGNILCTGNTHSTNGNINQPGDPSYGDILLVEFSKDPVATQNISKLAQTIVCYPNPVEDYLNLYSPQLAALTIRLHDITGRKIMEKQLNGQNTQLDLHNLQQGTYILGILNNEHQILSTQKIYKH
jgi:hypothetical protein